MAKKVGWIELILTFLKFLFQKRKEKVVKNREDAKEIKEALKTKYEEVDKKKEKKQEEAEDFDNAVDRLNDRF